MTLLFDTQHASLTDGGFSYLTDRHDLQLSQVTDPTDPTGDANIIRQPWGGVLDGLSPNFQFRGVYDTHIFFSTVARVPSSLMPTNEVKWIEFMDSRATWAGFYPAGNGQYEMRGVIRGNGGDRVSSRVGSLMPIPTGEWMKVQIELRRSPALFRLWINDVLVQEGGADFVWGDANAFGELQMGAVWGGGNGVPAPQGAVIDYARTAVWTCTSGTCE